MPDPTEQRGRPSAAPASRVVETDHLPVVELGASRASLHPAGRMPQARRLGRPYVAGTRPGRAKAFVVCRAPGRGEGGGITPPTYGRAARPQVDGPC